MENNKTQHVVFGGGCFWCTEAIFKMLKGVQSVLPGYAGGKMEDPSYDEVSGGNTGHAEVVEIAYDPELITFRDLLTVFFGSHDPTTLDRQGSDVGTQYRSVVFHTTPAQEAETKKFIEEINNSNPDGVSVTTEVKPFKKFYKAENYHEDYFAKNANNAYCQIIINPKLKKVQEQFANLLKAN